MNGLFLKCCTALFGPDCSVGQVAEGFDVHIRTAKKWMCGDEGVPANVWVEARAMLDDKLALVREVMGELDGKIKTIVKII